MRGTNRADLCKVKKLVLVFFDDLVHVACGLNFLLLFRRVLLMRVDLYDLCPHALISLDVCMLVEFGPDVTASS